MDQEHAVWCGDRGNDGVHIHVLVSCYYPSSVNSHHSQDCDMPAELQVPAAHQDLGIEKTDVMAFLGLKRAVSVNNKSEVE